MKNFLKALFFVVPYPAAIVYHLILGGFAAFLLVALITFSPATAATYATGLIGGGIFLLIGFLVWRAAQAEPQGVARQRYAAEGKYFSETQAMSGLAVSQYAGKWSRAKEYVTYYQPGLTAPGYWDAVRLHYLEIGGLWSDQVGK